MNRKNLILIGGLAAVAVLGVLLSKRAAAADTVPVFQPTGNAGGVTNAQAGDTAAAWDNAIASLLRGPAVVPDATSWTATATPAALAADQIAEVVAPAPPPPVVAGVAVAAPAAAFAQSVGGAAYSPPPAPPPPPAPARVSNWDGDGNWIGRGRDPSHRD